MRHVLVQFRLDDLDAAASTDIREISNVEGQQGVDRKSLIPENQAYHAVNHAERPAAAQR
jgi:hypothetical protein